jgi:hypothetical protein
VLTAGKMPSRREPYQNAVTGGGISPSEARRIEEMRAAIDAPLSAPSPLRGRYDEMAWLPPDEPRAESRYSPTELRMLGRAVDAKQAMSGAGISPAEARRIEEMQGSLDAQLGSRSPLAAAYGEESGRFVPYVMSDKEAKEDAFRAGARAGAESTAARLMPSPDMDAAKRAANADIARVNQFVTDNGLVQSGVTNTGQGGQVYSYRPPSGGLLAGTAQAPAPAPAASPVPPPMQQAAAPSPTMGQRLRGMLPASLSSDERGKTGKQEPPADAFLDTLTPYTYRYKDPSNEPAAQPTGGRYLGVMAQNVEKAPQVGEQIVKDTPKGKVLEGGALMSALAAGEGRLNERVRQLEAMLRKQR